MTQGETYRSYAFKFSSLSGWTIEKDRDNPLMFELDEFEDEEEYDEVEDYLVNPDFYDI